MVKAPILFFSFMAGGVGLLGLATGVFSPRTHHVVPAPVVAETRPAPVEVPKEITIAETEIVSAPPPAPLPAPKRTVRRHVAAAKPAPEATEPPPAPSARPCGEWSEVSAVYESGKGATGVRRVRALCF